jgi:membrane protease YdiL (CAAX protease family)
MSNSIGLTAPFFSLVIFGFLYLPILSRFLPGPGWLRLPFSPQVFFFLSSVVILRVKRLRFADIGFSKDRWLKRSGFGIAIGFIPVAAVLLLALLLTQIDGIHPFLKRPLFGGAPLENGIRAYDLATLLLLAPISEEIFFRGILFRGLRENYPTWIAVVASALIFMGGHGRLAFGPLALGVINAIVVLRTGSIVPGMLFHSIANAYGPVMVFWFPNLYRYLQFLYQ